MLARLSVMRLSNREEDKSDMSKKRNRRRKKEKNRQIVFIPIQVSFKSSRKGRAIETEEGKKRIRRMKT